MADEENLSPCDDHGTSVFHVMDRYLSSFTKTIEEIESGGYVVDHGIYKLKVDGLSRTEGTSPKELLKLLRPHLKSNCVLQELKKYLLCDTALGYRSHSPGSGGYMDDFAKKMKNVSYYSAAETCCSLILKNSEDPKAVVKHWYQEAESFRVEARSRRSNKIKHDKEEQERLLVNGRELKAKYKRLLASSSYSAECKKDKPEFNLCSCVDCFSESEPEDEPSAQSQKKPPEKFRYPERDVLSKFPRYTAGIQLLPKQNVVKVTKNFSMCNITSVLDLMPAVFRGLQIPYFYAGETHSCFAAHCEDAALYAANYLHLGFPKIWVTVSAEFCDKIRNHLRTLRMDLVHTSCVNSLNHKFFLFTLKFFEDLNIPYHITVQYVGEMVILQPDTLHFGFNAGPCVAEAVN